MAALVLLLLLLFGSRWTAVFRVVSSICEAWGTDAARVNERARRRRRSNGRKIGPEENGRPTAGRPQTQFCYKTETGGADEK